MQKYKIVFFSIVCSSLLTTYSGFSQDISPDKVKPIFGILPKVADNPANPVTPEKVNLGRYLFFEPRLSKSAKISCNSCHSLANSGVDGLPTSIGHKWQIGPRNAPTVLNAALQFTQFWDGRAKDVEEQAMGPMLNPKEMASTKELVVQRLKSIPQYEEMFHKAFPEDTDPITFENAAKAIAAFERTLLTLSRFDRYMDGDLSALSPEEKEGLKTFIQTGCITCHNGTDIGGGMFQKFGLVHKVEWLQDLGRFEVTKNPADKYVFKVPSLRNVTKTAPYFNNGRVWSLEEAVKTMGYVQLGKNLSDEEVKKIVSFLGSLAAEPPLQITLPNLPPSTAKTPKPMP
ncbi:cytochrome-c peroxidase [Candidatus Methylacidiphilum fumarolicum]|uniref:Cytochrome c peroxidase n=2 Tax=Candidatus Methylacidiphilum fumarolicum TaxID=591154 RepID=I0JYV3_METFB|nr:cytochrome-c peroxidase [Candidatus Methylacidiphilum fumarolicum]MBW6415022.1 cytochrome-c peroxidase [Candidatus Methylacidiphilum fumarolicum]TFE69741.1 cytochrome-c peroxidase [Candidatus Methylacidiphilum fumarolicum]TFE74909.1 cytochrome-c peroxidase [Candidatus Methylacidiphilum fumarolicum]TFE75543.1 cytochrome-c peroxidase [Candidatus Methylacidiphilum fumarolicum]TFE77947.1 cytochrome-c peroxidase [Candidatus Methylacidiphilum fumarolicum]